MGIEDLGSMRNNSIGLMLRKAREKSGLTQAAVAKHLRYNSAQFVSNWERGVSLPPLEIFPKLSKLYHLQPKTIMMAVEKYHEDLIRSRNQRLKRLLERGKRRA